MMEQAAKAPLGAMTQWRWRERRVHDLSGAIARAVADDCFGEPEVELLLDWAQEMAMHLEWLRTRQPKGLDETGGDECPHTGKPCVEHCTREPGGCMHGAPYPDQQKGLE